MKDKKQKKRTRTRKSNNDAPPIYPVHLTPNSVPFPVPIPDPDNP
jgi:hypothetical protein